MRGDHPPHPLLHLALDHGIVLGHAPVVPGRVGLGRVGQESVETLEGKRGECADE